jgi:uncharacterized protein YkwD
MTALLFLLACTPGGSDGDTAGGELGMTDLERAVYDAINDHREGIGLEALASQSLMLELARGHSQDMADGVVAFSHDGFEEYRAPTIAENLAIQSVAENVAYLNSSPDPVSDAVQGWLNSEGHRLNIEGEFDLTGLGVAEVGKDIYLTQLFALSL